MAKKEEAKLLERTYTIPLRREYSKVPGWRRTKKAVKACKEFLQKHMKSQNVKLSTTLNEKIWNHGGKNPPHHVKVRCLTVLFGSLIILFYRDVYSRCEQLAVSTKDETSF